MSDNGDLGATRWLIYEAVLDRLKAQVQSIDRVETKGTIILGFAVVSAQFVISAMLDPGSNGANETLLAAAMVAHGLAFLTGLVVIAPFRHAYPPDPSSIFEDYWNIPEEELVRRLTATRAFAFGINAHRGKLKTRFWWASLTFLVLGVALTGLAYRPTLLPWL